MLDHQELKQAYRDHLIDDKINLKDLSVEELEQFFANIGQPKYRSHQLTEWIYQKRIDTFDQITNFSQKLRDQLQEIAALPKLELIKAQHSKNKDTSKFLFRLPKGGEVESVLMRYPLKNNRTRNAVCISSQVGCAMACNFCASGLLGLQRNLETWEIIEQVLTIERYLQKREQRVSNLVYMGLGEPMHNYQAVLKSVRLLNHPKTLNIGQRHITISTSGLVPEIEKLSQEGLACTLAISLHAPNDDLRAEIMPINKKWPIPKLLQACHEYQTNNNRRLTFEYILIDRLNDTPQLAHQLADILQGLICHVNLIPWNPVEGIPYRRSTPEAVERFQNILEKRMVPCTLRREKGGDIEAACGQLRLHHADEKQKKLLEKKLSSYPRRR